MNTIPRPYMRQLFGNGPLANEDKKAVIAVGMCADTMAVIEDECKGAHVVSLGVDELFDYDGKLRFNVAITYPPHKRAMAVVRRLLDYADTVVALVWIDFLFGAERIRWLMDQKPNTINLVQKRIDGRHVAWVVWERLPPAGSPRIKWL